MFRAETRPPGTPLRVPQHSRQQWADGQGTPEGRDAAASPSARLLLGALPGSLHLRTARQRPEDSSGRSRREPWERGSSPTDTAVLVPRGAQQVEDRVGALGTPARNLHQLQL